MARVLTINPATGRMTQIDVSEGASGVSGSFLVEFDEDDAPHTVTYQLEDAAITTDTGVFLQVEGEEAAIQSITATVSNKAVGSCDVIVHAPEGATGTFTIYYQIMA